MGDYFNFMVIVSLKTPSFAFQPSYVTHHHPQVLLLSSGVEEGNSLMVFTHNIQLKKQ